MIGYDSAYFRSALIDEDHRLPASFQGTNGDFVTVGHFRGVLREGNVRKCNFFSCYDRDAVVLRSRGQYDILLRKYNSSRVLQWTRHAGGDGDDKAQAVTVNMEGKIIMAGYITGYEAAFGQSDWDITRISSRTMLSRTLFVALYSANGTVLFVKEAATCAMRHCDVTAVAADETGMVLTGRYRSRISFAAKQVCALPHNECIDVEGEFLTTGQPKMNVDKEMGPIKKSTGSGNVYADFCWMAKFDTFGNFSWARACFDPGLSLDTHEIQSWGQSARAFWKNRPEDRSRVLGKEEQYDQYSRYKMSDFGSFNPPTFNHGDLAHTNSHNITEFEPPLSTNHPSKFT